MKVGPWVPRYSGWVNQPGPRECECSVVDRQGVVLTVCGLPGLPWPANMFRWMSETIVWVSVTLCWISETMPWVFTTP